jgi:hypothetical protein
MKQLGGEIHSTFLFFAIVVYGVYSSTLSILPNNEFKLFIFASHPFGFYPHT